MKSLKEWTKLSTNILLVVIYLLNILSQVLLNEVPTGSGSGGGAGGSGSGSGINRKIETSHSNEIKSFDDSIYYRINWLGDNREQMSPDVDQHIQQFAQWTPSSSEPKDVVHDSNVLYITTASHERYVCTLPQIDAVSESLDSQTKSEFSTKSGYQLLKPLMVREVCSYRLEQYWTYEICHGKHIRQFHEDNGPQKTSKNSATQEYYLGRYELSRLGQSEQQFDGQLKQLARDGRRRPTVTVDETQLPYVEVNMTDGTICDLSNTKRFTRVLYVCNEDAKHELYSIKETSTCEYEAIVLSPLLCQSSEFQVSAAPENQINCYPVDKSPAKPKALKTMEAEVVRQQLEVLKNKDKFSPFPGGIFDGKTIIIGANDFGKELRINIVTNEDGNDEPSGEDLAAKFDSKILTNFLSGDLCLHGGTGWWRYEFCYGNKVEQYHEEKGVKMTVITLGKWDKRQHINWLNKNPSKRPKSNKTPKQVSHYYSNGDACDMTGKSRSVEVKMKCRNIAGHPDSVALYLLEPKTCEYILGIESPIICQLLSSADENGLLYNPNIKLTENLDTISSDGDDKDDEEVVNLANDEL